MKKITISTKYYNNCNEVEKNFIQTYANEIGVQSCKTVISILHKNNVKSKNIKKNNVIILFNIIDESNDKYIVRLSTGMIGDENKFIKIID